MSGIQLVFVRRSSRLSPTPAMQSHTGEARRPERWQESATGLRGEWDSETALWTQRLSGNDDQLPGPAHGFAGCVLALSLRADDELHRRAAAAVRRCVVEEDG